MEFLPLYLWQDFNNLYTDSLNCDIVAPPFYQWRIPFSFFFKKRWAFSKIETAEEFDIIYDYYEEWTDLYYIWRIGTNVIVKHWATTLHTSTYVDWVFYKFFLAQWVKWTPVESWTWANWIVVWTDIVIQDLTKSWVVNAYALKYVYIYEATSWAWQIFQIDSNTTTDLVITNTGWIIPPVNAKYKIFDDYTAVLSFVSWDYIYNIQSDTSVLPIKSIINPKDAIFFDWYYYIVGQDNKVWRWGESWFAWYFWFGSYLWTKVDIVNIINFKDYILLLWTSSISAIRIINRVNSVWDTVATPVILPVTTDIALFKQWAYVIYNVWLYVISQNKQFLWVEITDVWIDKYTVNTTNQWIYIQKFLDNFSTSSSIRIWIDDQNIYITVKDSWSTTMYRYDILYKWWHRWETLLPIVNYKYRKFIWDTLYIKWYDALTDEWWLQYNQNLRVVIWEDSIFNNKRALITKIYVWKNTTMNSKIKYLVFAGGNTDSYEKILWESWYVQDIAWYWLQTSWTLWWQLLWISLLWESLTNWLDLIADVATIENPTWFFYELCIIDLSAEWTEEFETWGLMIWYTKFEPQVTAYRNVI